MLKDKTIIFPHKPGYGGPGSFQKRINHEIINNNGKIKYEYEQNNNNLVFIVGGTRRLLWLLKLKLKKIPIVYRLDGLNWIHKKDNNYNFLISEIQNLIMNIIRKFFATYIVYQSKFVKDWWETKGWRTNKENFIIYNGVNLDNFSPKNRYSQTNLIDLLIVEGTIDYSPYAINLLNDLQEKLIENSNYRSIKLYGRFKDKKNIDKLSPMINYEGFVDVDNIANVYNNAVYLSLDVNAACPNTVIESLSSGIPVIGYDTGSLSELVDPLCGVVCSYGGDAWNLDYPNVDNLVESALKVLDDWGEYSKNARKFAEKKFDIKLIVKDYLKVIKMAYEQV